MYGHFFSLSHQDFLNLNLLDLRFMLYFYFNRDLALVHSQMHVCCQALDTPCLSEMCRFRIAVKSVVSQCGLRELTELRVASCGMLGQIWLVMMQLLHHIRITTSPIGEPEFLDSRPTNGYSMGRGGVSMPLGHYENILSLLDLTP